MKRQIPHFRVSYYLHYSVLVHFQFLKLAMLQFPQYAQVQSWLHTETRDYCCSAENYNLPCQIAQIDLLEIDQYRFPFFFGKCLQGSDRGPLSKYFLWRKKSSSRESSCVSHLTMHQALNHCRKA